MKKQSLAGIGLVFFFAACSSGGSGSSGSGGSQGSSSGGSQGSSSGGSNGSSSGGSQGSSSGGSNGSSSGGSQGSGSGGSNGSSSGGSQGSGSGGSQGSSSGGAQGTGSGGSMATGSGGSMATGSGGSMATGSGGSMATGSGGASAPSMLIVTSSPSGYWQTGTWMEASSGNATVTVDDSTTITSKWEGFGGAFNERGWMYLTSDDMKNQALTLLFDRANGAGFTWGRIPMGASDYAINRYTCDDKGEDPTPMSNGSNRPAADTSMSNFTLDQDKKYLIPFIQAAQKVNPDLRFWASPWTPPVWMKTGYKTDNGSGGTAKKPSYYDGGSFVTNNTDYLTAYATYYTKFVQGYMDQGIKIEIVSPQNEPGYDQNYPSALWDSATYVTWIGKYLGPAMQKIGVNVMLGTLSNYMDNGKMDLSIASAVLNDSTAKGFVTVAGVQWGVLEQIDKGMKIGDLPIWATEHKCGNYPWYTSTQSATTNPPVPAIPAYNSSQAPNDQNYGVESWAYIRNAINLGHVTSYSAWNMVLDKNGLGNDTSRDWRQDALLVADSGKITATPAYYVFRHVAQYVMPGASVIKASGGDGVAFKNPDGSLVVATYNSGSAVSNYIVSIGGKKVQFNMPSNGWATVVYKP